MGRYYCWIGALVFTYLKSSFALLGFGAYLSAFTSLPLQYAAIVLLSLIVLLNVVGVGKLSKAVIFVVFCIIVSLTALSIGGVFYFDSQIFDATKNGVFGFIEATGFVFVAFAGVDKVTKLPEEVKEQRKIFLLEFYCRFSL